MSDLAASQPVTVGSGAAARQILVYELTPVEYRKILIGTTSLAEEADAETIARYQLDQVLLGEVSLSDLALFVRLPVSELEMLPPTQLRKLLAKAKELNPDFFAALVRLATHQSEP
ncbi:MAG: hypothetical protein KJ884_04855 [Gammaproteobacteria bacterium]|uniref:Tail assembly chaperone n=1 Tax=viral metagenome TaxID=1070528 RepID=A0A6M3J9X4_9ZZZZ|nr:hypothetical protein [Gammaproteobacteria bacterium]MBU1492222.1 hypothetical protein [Gammaproteobacteria bacterium]MBU2066793.1 hypothetical protein [Gammaproteobacteria bacterium]MBU2137391.1 hypothetical protein [Gammaproteobacteria bacterium]MBU2215048.1 hypothetical protein [Gammaproteobacteria bacterium]